ncbi:acylphosphatase [archaeon]|nr:acylphosphatase [archaeon]
MKSVEIVIRGPRVQEVGYRIFLLEEADRLQLPFFEAINVGTDTLVVRLRGPEEHAERFLEFVKTKKPPLCQVEHVEVKPYEGDIRDR